MLVLKPNKPQNYYLQLPPVKLFPLKCGRFYLLRSCEMVVCWQKDSYCRNPSESLNFSEVGYLILLIV